MVFFSFSFIKNLNYFCKKIIFFLPPPRLLRPAPAYPPPGGGGLGVAMHRRFGFEERNLGFPSAGPPPACCPVPHLCSRGKKTSFPSAGPPPPPPWRGASLTCAPEVRKRVFLRRDPPPGWPPVPKIWSSWGKPNVLWGPPRVASRP